MSNKEQVVILGATSDVGRELAYCFAKEASSLILSSRNPQQLEPLQKDILVKGLVPEVELIAIDTGVLDEGKLRRLAAKTDVLILTIGYLGDQKKAETDWTEAERIIQSNFSGLVSILNIFASEMEQRKSGSIIGLSSVAGERGRQSNYLYGSSKAGFTAYLSGLRNRLYKSGVHVLTVLPGFMDTKMTADLDLPKPITAAPQVAAKKIYKGWKRKKNIIYVLPIWRYIMFIIKNIPEFVFKRLGL